MLPPLFLSLFPGQAEQSGPYDQSAHVNYAGVTQSRAWGRACAGAVEQRESRCKPGHTEQSGWGGRGLWAEQSGGPCVGSNFSALFVAKFSLLWMLDVLARV